jgi:hypothetical protein
MLPNVANYDTYGGELEDYSLVEDPTTDLAADLANEQRVDTAGMTATALRAFVVFTWSVDEGVTIRQQGAVWGNGTSPTIALTAPGTFTITWPSTATDARGVSRSVNLRAGWVSCQSGAGPMYPPTLNFNGANAAVVEFTNSSGAVTPTTPISVFVL